MKIAIKKPGVNIKYCNLKPTFNNFYMIIGEPFIALPKGNLNIFMGKSVNKGPRNITIDGIDVCGPIIISGSTSTGIETDLTLRNLKEIKELNFI